MSRENAQISHHANPLPNRCANRGAIFRLFGVILVILGWLNTMLSWRGGFEIIPFHAMLIGTGMLLYLIGAIRRGSRS